MLAAVSEKSFQILLNAINRPRKPQYNEKSSSTANFWSPTKRNSKFFVNTQNFKKLLGLIRRKKNVRLLKTGYKKSRLTISRQKKNLVSLIKYKRSNLFSGVPKNFRLALIKYKKSKVPRIKIKKARLVARRFKKKKKFPGRFFRRYKNRRFRYKKVKVGLYAKVLGSWETQKQFKRHLKAKIRGKFKNKIKPKTKRYYGFLNNSLVLKFVIDTQIELGERMNKHNQNLTVISNYVVKVRNGHAVYNMYIIIFTLRYALKMVFARLLYKDKCLINYAENATVRLRNNLSNAIAKPPSLDKFPRKTYMVTWNKWLGGVLTNFKAIAKRIVSLKRNAWPRKKTHFVSYEQHMPRLPSFVVCTNNNHWALNEARHLGVANLQVINTYHLGPYGFLNVAMNSHYYGIRVLTNLLMECTAAMDLEFKLLKKNRVIRKLRRRGKYKAHLAKTLALTFHMVLYIVLLLYILMFLEITDYLDKENYKKCFNKMSKNLTAAKSVKRLVVNLKPQQICTERQNKVNVSTSNKNLFKYSSVFQTMPIFCKTIIKICHRGMHTIGKHGSQASKKVVSNVTAEIPISSTNTTVKTPTSVVGSASGGGLGNSGENPSYTTLMPKFRTPSPQKVTGNLSRSPSPEKAFADTRKPKSLAETYTPRNLSPTKNENKAIIVTGIAGKTPEEKSNIRFSVTENIENVSENLEFPAEIKTQGVLKEQSKDTMEKGNTCLSEPENSGTGISRLTDNNTAFLDAPNFTENVENKLQDSSNNLLSVSESFQRRNQQPTIFSSPTTKECTSLIPYKQGPKNRTS